MAIEYSQKSVLAARYIEFFVFVVTKLFGLVFPSKREIDYDAPLILIVEPFHIGDVISLSVMFDPILAKYPNAKILLWCDTKNKGIFTSDKRVAVIESAPFFWAGAFSTRQKLATLLPIFKSMLRIRRMRPDFGLDPRGDVRSQALLALTNCKRRIGLKQYHTSNIVLRGLLLTDAITPFAAPLHRYRSNLRLLQPILGAVPELQLPSLRPTCPIHSEKKRIVAHTGARWRFREWPAERWREVFRQIAQNDALEIVLLAGPGELDAIQKLVKGIPGNISCVQTSFQDLVNTIAGASLFLGTDSGPANLSFLLAIPAVVLYGPGDMSLWGPPTEKGLAIHHTEMYPCHPCSQKVCVHPDVPCMDTIQPDEVIAAVQAKLFPEQSLVSLR